VGVRVVGVQVGIAHGRGIVHDGLGSTTGGVRARCFPG